MFRHAPNFLLILIVLGCPLAGFCEAMQGGQWWASAQDELIKPAGGCPLCPDSDHESRSCFCGGAVLGDRPGPSAGQPELPASAVTLPAADALAAAARFGGCSSTCLARFLSPISGRQILVLIACLRL